MSEQVRGGRGGRARVWLAAGLAAGLAAVATAQQPAKADPVGQAIDQTLQTHRAAVASQTSVNQLDDATRQLLERYRAATWQAQQLTVYAGQLQQLLDSQEAEKASLERQISEMDRVERDLMPLLLRMLDGLEKFVPLDLPFLKDERSERIASLKRLMSDPEANLAEKYRRILEAYQVEAEYGRTLGAERSEIDGRIMDVLRIGRTGLFALSLDGESPLRWEATGAKWEPLEPRYVGAVKKGLRIARETSAADLLVLPMPVAQKEAP
ncbi:MAG TPA: DUF3450 domain-containing protein [Solimonas sp.]|nr:DUF3450 domain-containing protein [Solimonas sp.]